jgi:carbonic anhydrase
MRKLIEGIVDFRKQTLPAYREAFGHLALDHSPDALMIACSDSRVVPNLFASTDPGDLFVVRNVGNMIPPCLPDGRSSADESEGAAIEFAVNQLNISNIIVCGHSECGAMRALLNGRENERTPNLKEWLRHGEEALRLIDSRPDLSPEAVFHNRLSQLNVLLQLEHLKSYPVVDERIKSGRLRLHGWWFELSRADVFAYDENTQQFFIIDETTATKIIENL